MSYAQKRIPCFFSKGKAFYIEFNIRLCWWLLFQKMDLICAIDLDTILPCFIVSKIKRIPRVFDAHELFCEMKEVITRPAIQWVWKSIEKFAVPRFRLGYTVSKSIAEVFWKDYGVSYPVIRNFARYNPPPPGIRKEKSIIYQGAVNEGRSFETLIPAMQWVDVPLYIYGDGNFMDKAKKLITEYSLENKVFLQGKILPAELPAITASALVGITLFENTGQSNYCSLANRFFDYLQAGLPQLCSDYPEYREINDQFNIALLIVEHSPKNIARELNYLLQNEVLANTMSQNCLSAALKLNWENEEASLISFYQKILK